MSWLFSRALVAEYSAASCSGGELCAPLSVMPTPHKFWHSGKTIDALSLSQFGLTCAVLTESLGLELLTWFQEGFRAKTSAAPGKVQDLTANARACGWKWPASLAKYDPSSRSWRTRQCSLLGGLTEFSETWPRWGLMRDGEFWEQTTLAPHTDVSEFGLWPTPRRTDADRGGRGDLIQAVRGNTNSHFKMWPTPHGFSKDGKSNGPSGNELGRAVNQRPYPTPLARDAHNRSGQAKRYLEQGRVNLQDRNAADGIRGSLNPTWVEWLMGWCQGWTDLKPLATDRFRSWRQQHGGF